MATKKQLLGAKAEAVVCARCTCPRCKREGTLRRLPPNFKCADVVCDFCGFLAQVKGASVSSLGTLPTTILGGAWSVQKERMDAGIFFPLFIVLVDSRGRTETYYLPADLQTVRMFHPRKPLSSSARRAGWQGFIYDLGKAASSPVKLP